MYDAAFIKEIKKAKRKEMTSLFRKAFTSLQRLRLTNIRLTLECGLGEGEFNFDITVFEENGSNCTLSFYNFQDLNKIEVNLDGLLKVIKCDDFEKVKSYIGNAVLC